jgi:deoxyribonuclease-4
LDEIEAIIDACGGDERLGLCIDTQHLWASGFDYSSVAGATRLVKEISSGIGLSRLRCFHLNDSKIELGGNKDRHANIDEGTIGSKGLAPLVGHPKIRELPMLLEVPGTGDGPRAEDVKAAEKMWRAGVKLYDAASTSSAAKSATKPATKPATKVVAAKKSAPKPSTAAAKKSTKSTTAPKKGK